MLKCIFVSKELQLLSTLEKYIDKVPFLQLVGSAANLQSTIEMARQLQIDIAFINLDLLYSFQIEHLIMIACKCQIVPIIDAQKSSVDECKIISTKFLIEPVSFSQFVNVAQKIIDHQTSGLVHRDSSVTDNFILVKTGHKGKLVRVDLNDILYIEGLKNYVSIYTKNARTITLVAIKDLEEKLSTDFIRIHKSYIISTKWIREIEGNQVLLNEVKKSIPMGGSFKAAFFESVRSRVVGGKI